MTLRVEAVTIVLSGLWTQVDLAPKSYSGFLISNPQARTCIAMWPSVPRHFSSVSLPCLPVFTFAFGRPACRSTVPNARVLHLLIQLPSTRRSLVNCPKLGPDQADLRL